MGVCGGGGGGGGPAFAIEIDKRRKKPSTPFDYLHLPTDEIGGRSDRFTGILPTLGAEFKRASLEIKKFKN